MERLAVLRGQFELRNLSEDIERGGGLRTCGEAGDQPQYNKSENS